MPWTLFLYLAKQSLTALMIVVSVFGIIIFLGDFTELLRRTAGKAHISLDQVLGMALLKLPNLMEEALPFIVLLATLLYFFRLLRNHELVAIRATGLSIWQMLAPVLSLTLAVGVLAVTIYNPIAALLFQKYKYMENVLIQERSEFLSVSNTGLWLRQNNNGGWAIIHADQASKDNQTLTLEDVTIFYYDNDYLFSGRIDAPRARLVSGYWRLDDVWLTHRDQTSEFLPSYRQPSTLTAEQILKGFVEPRTVSFWSLNQTAKLAESAGFSTTQYRLHYLELMILPALMCVMALLAAIFPLNLDRSAKTRRLWLGGIPAGFIFFFLSQFFSILGDSEVVPVYLAAWGPTLITACFTLTILIYQEDG